MLKHAYAFDCLLALRSNVWWWRVHFDIAREWDERKKPRRYQLPSVLPPAPLPPLCCSRVEIFIAARNCDETRINIFLYFFISLDPRRKWQNMIRPWQNISTTFDRHDSKRAPRTITPTTHFMKKKAAAERHRSKWEKARKREVKVYVSSSIYRNYVILSLGREQKKSTTTPTTKKKNVQGTFSSFSSIKSSLYRSSWFPQCESHSLALRRFLSISIYVLSSSQVWQAFCGYVCFSLLCRGSSVLYIIRSSISGGFHVISSSLQSDSNTL